MSGIAKKIIGETIDFRSVEDILNSIVRPAPESVLSERLWIWDSMIDKVMMWMNQKKQADRSFPLDQLPTSGVEAGLSGMKNSTNFLNEEEFKDYANRLLAFIRQHRD